MILYCLHYLGGSAREYDAVSKLLDPGIALVALDLPGFGDAAHVAGYTVDEMATYVAARIREAAPDRFMLVGHSMGAKVVAALARRIEDDPASLPGFSGAIFIAGSPPSPEPMPPEQRAKMLSWFAGDAQTSRAQAAEYVDANSGERLDDASAERAREDVLRADRAAWVAWLERGSREDLSERVGILRSPALAIAGADDENLGPDAQRRLLLPHLQNARLVTLPGAKHLLPLECAADLARLFGEHARFADRERAYRALVASPRVGSPTRAALEARALPETREPTALDARAFATLRAVVDRVLPQPDPAPIDVAARIDRRLSENAGDGWRFAILPPDGRAYASALATLDAIAAHDRGTHFAGLDDGTRDEILRCVAAGDLGAPLRDGTAPDLLDAKQLRAWFEDLRAAVVEAYVLHPTTLARIGYSGIANGGDGSPKSGFSRIGYGERESWEPVADTEALR